MAELGPNLREIDTAGLDMHMGLLPSDVERGGFKPPATLVRVRLAGHIACVSHQLEVGAMALGQSADVEPCHRVGAGVEHAPDELCVVGNEKPLVCQQPADAGVVGHGGEGPCIGTAATATASTAVIGALVRIIPAR